MSTPAENVFDQFDAPQRNVFDQFDEPEVQEPEVQEPEVQEPIARPISQFNDPRGAIVPILSTAIAEPISGLAGIIGLIGGAIPGGESPSDKAARFVEATKEFITLDPPNQASQDVLETIGRGIESLRKPARVLPAAFESFGLDEETTATRRFEDRLPAQQEKFERLVEGGLDIPGRVSEVTGSPLLGAVTAAAPAGLASLLGVRLPVRRAPRTPETPIRPTVADPIGPPVSVGRPTLDQPVDFTPPISAEKIVSDLRKGKTEQLAQAVVPDVEVINSAQRLGIDLNVEHYSTNTAFQDVARALKVKPGSGLLVGEVQALRNLATKADELVTDIGGAIDKGVVSDEILFSTRTTIDKLMTKAEIAYTKVKEAIPSRTRIQTTNLKEFIDKRIADFGGDQALLSRSEKTLAGMIERGKDGTVTYAALDRVRKDVADGFTTRTGPFANDSERILQEVYDALSDTQKAAAEAFGVGEVYQGALELVIKRKGIEDQAVQLFGRDAAGSLVPKIRAAATSLPKGDITAFNKLMNALTKARRGEVAATVLGELFAAGSRQGGALGTGFALTWRNLNRNKSARDTLMKHLPQEARKRFDDIGRVIDAIVRSNAKSLANPSGSAGPIIAALEQGTIATKLYSAGQAVAGEAAVGVVGGIPGLATVLRATGGGKPKVAQVTAADEFLTSQTFKDAVKVSLDGDLVRANRIVQDSPQFNKWLGTLDQQTAQRIGAIGFIAWLSGEDNGV